MRSPVGQAHRAEETPSLASSIDAGVPVYARSVTGGPCLFLRICRLSGILREELTPWQAPQALLSDASTAIIAIMKASMMITLPTITSQRPGTEMRLMAL